MRGWLVGLVIGLLAGAFGMYLVLRPPWGGGGTTSTAIDAGVATAPVDAGVKPKKRPGGKRRPTPGQPPGNDIDDGGEAPPIQLSAADRALEWRGDDVSLPPQRIDMNGAETRTLDQGEINGTLGSQTAGVRGCIVQAATGTDLSATITIQIVVDGSGRVTKTKLQAPRHLFNQGLYACASRSLRGLKFPSTGAPTLVTFPVNLG